MLMPVSGLPLFPQAFEEYDEAVQAIRVNARIRASSISTKGKQMKIVKEIRVNARIRASSISTCKIIDHESWTEYGVNARIRASSISTGIYGGYKLVGKVC